MININDITIGRFAPSPTGYLHLGSLVAAVGSYVLSKQLHGKWLLRIEDLDSSRVIPGATEDIIRTIEALGFQWDGEIVYQSRRLAIYKDVLQRLIEDGYVYPCGCSRSEIAQMSNYSDNGELVYPGTCSRGIPEGKVKRAFRVRVSGEIITFRDGIMGLVSQHLPALCGDFIVKRADGPFAYHLAVVIDDAESRVNQIVRGVDLLDSTPRQIFLQRVLGYQCPSYSHVPVVTNPDGKKLSKRENALSLTSGRNLEKDGWRLLLGALRFLGQHPPTYLNGASCQEILSWAVSSFDPQFIPQKSAPFHSISI